jgi:hypothetical protein
MASSKNNWQDAGQNGRSYLLRCWPETGAGPAGLATCRYCLVRLGDGETQSIFAKLEALMAYLRQELDDV